MKKVIIVAAIFLCGASLSLSYGQSAGKQSVVLRGATTTEAFIAPWVKEFGSANPGIEVDIKGSHQQEGFRALLTKKADILMSARLIKEAEKSEAAQRGLKLEEVWLENEGLAIVVNPANPVNELTIEQLVKLWNGEYATWDKVGGPNAAVSLIVAPPDSAMRQLLERDFLKQPAAKTATSVQGATNSILLIPVREGALTYLRTDLAMRSEKEKKLKILAIKKDSNSPAVKASPESASDGSYPFTRPLSLIYDGATVTEPTKKLLEFCKGKCSDKKQK
jgi:phosphate transport system substrate-binding protein